MAKRQRTVDVNDLYDERLLKYCKTVTEETQASVLQQESIWTTNDNAYESSIFGNVNTGTIDHRKNLMNLFTQEGTTFCPRYWSLQHKSNSIELSYYNLRANFTNRGFARTGSIRTDLPIPIPCGFYYFEVKVHSIGMFGKISVGLTSEEFNENLLPGWNEKSYGYYGSGFTHNSMCYDIPFGADYTQYDVIGCLVNFRKNSCHFTRNGVDTGITFTELPKILYPTVGFVSPGGEICANFGQESFVLPGKNLINILKKF